MHPSRKLAAILAADIAGYSRMMGLDEAGTAKALSEHRVAVDPILAGRGGRVFKATGDGFLVEFSSIVAAVEAAIAVQRLMTERNTGVPEYRRMLFRIGINLGDVLIEGDDILGDGVNVASRLEGIAEPGGICVSEDAYRHVQGKTVAVFADAGEQQLKNIARPVRIYQVKLDRPSAPALSPLPLPDKPSIAVLPFQNMSGDPEQEYFADGVVEEIITALSRFRELFVIARNSTFTYKGKAADVKRVGHELGVRYVLEGSVRKAGNKLRITAQLIDAPTGAHIWADRFDGILEDIFELQDAVTGRVAASIAPSVQQAEIARAQRKPVENLCAYDLYLRGLANVHEWTRDGNERALSLFNKATEMDPGFATAYAGAAWCYVWRKANAWAPRRDFRPAEAARLAHRAVELDRGDSVALTWGGYALAFVCGDLEAGASHIDRALILNPNSVSASGCRGWVAAYQGDVQLALDHFAKAMRMSPLDPLLFALYGGIALAHFLAEKYDDAADWAERAWRLQPRYHAALRIAAASNALRGDGEAAARAVTELRALDPELQVSNVHILLPVRRHEHLSRFKAGLRMAGLAE
ncbi:adenylate/guanylate cyclase domain-containing protein [Bradyrhizobium sp. CER78]|uniref:adenylate/guanylate cyclase domain-containing protein n=1 Tax=Bradyrhizobium sp. CER78 TaxID=3039162 RepID=UPI00244869C5|nr:adenylate/guanylate cyclase domain-containing protein [Bradyrhizobium sp. CER78]MDH2386440.1 adenylate/guanylate cyclase domain-containing protein [Bradyrhizobium sp. CER78]